MPSLFTHAIVAGSLGQAGRADWRKDWRFWCVAILCSILPDIDTLGFRVGIHYADLWGHRGMTHSLLFAAVLAVVMVAIFWRAEAGVPSTCGSWFCACWGGGRGHWRLALLLFVITASHGVLDAMTSGGLGVAFFSPFDTRRYFFPWRPIPVSPIAASRFFSARGWHILSNEILWIWLPMLFLAAVIWIVRRRRKLA